MGWLTRNKKLVHYIIVTLFLFGFPHIPPIPPITEVGMGMLGVFFGAVYGWTTIGMLWPSVLALVAMGMVRDMNTVLAASFGSPIIMMMFIMLVTMAMLTETGATEVIARVLLVNKLTLGRPWRFMCLFFFAAFICANVNPIITLMIFMEFIRQIAKSANIPLKSPFTAFCAIGLALVTLFGQSTLPFHSSGLQYTATYGAMMGTPIPYWKWMVFFVFIDILATLVLLFVGRFILRLDVSGLANLDPSVFGEKKPITTEQKIPMVAFVAFIVILLVTSLLPATNPFAAIMNRLTIYGQVVIICCIMMLLTKPDGTEFFNFGRTASKYFSWDTVFMVALIMPLAQFLCAADTGISPFLAMVLKPLMTLPPLVFIIIAIAVAVFITNFANNFVVAIVFMPVFGLFAGQIGMNPMAPIMVLFVATMIAVGTPGASFPVGVCYSFSEIVDTPMMMKMAWVCVIFLAIAVIAVGLPVASMLF